MTRRARSLLEALEAFKHESAAGRAVEKTLVRLSRRDFRDAESLIPFHEALLFLRAYPQSARVVSQTERLLAGFARRVERLEKAGADLTPFDEPEVAGIAGTTIGTDFSYDLVRWLIRRHGHRVRIDWGACDAVERMRASWPYFLPLLSEEALADANVPYLAWLSAAAGKKSADPAWLLDRYGRLPGAREERAERYEALGLPVSWELGDSPASRTRMRRPARRIFACRRPLLSRRDVSLESEFAAPPLPVRRLSRREGEKLLDMARTSTAARYREFYTFTYGDPSAVFAARVGRGVEIFVSGLLPERRLPLRAGYAGLIVKNGVPVGYIEGLAFFERLEIGFNVYYTFREGESAWIYAKVLKLHTQILGVTSFSIDPYQLGYENQEAIESGAFWFYRKLGFRPTRVAIGKLLAAEERKIAADPSYRSSARMLKRLVTGNLLYEVPVHPNSEIRNPKSSSGPLGNPNSEIRNPKSAWSLFHIRNLGLAVNRRMAREFGGDAQRIKTSSTGRAARRLGVSLKNWSPLEAAAFESWALVLDLVPDLARWSREEKEAVLAIVRAKAGREERRYLRLMQRHTRLRAAVLRIGSRTSRN
ncbi:MAG TPA: hypothetical protein VLO07_06865 [Thermoanaerobaculia bacterium]|nr:hypothetical protein [Thermoanaerobaculia bacterium]